MYHFLMCYNSLTRINKQQDFSAATVGLADSSTPPLLPLPEDETRNNERV